VKPRLGSEALTVSRTGTHASSPVSYPRQASRNVGARKHISCLPPPAWNACCPPSDRVVVTVHTLSVGRGEAAGQGRPGSAEMGRGASPEPANRRRTVGEGATCDGQCRRAPGEPDSLLVDVGQGPGSGRHCCRGEAGRPGASRGTRADLDDDHAPGVQAPRPGSAPGRTRTSCSRRFARTPSSDRRGPERVEESLAVSIVRPGAPRKASRVGM
jgi:hypothetical protein